MVLVRPQSGTVAKALRRANLTAAIIWAMMLIPAVTLWKDSITFLAVVSVYALVQGHLNAYMAGRAEKKADENGSSPEQ